MNYVISIHGISVNLACKIVNLSRSVYYYVPILEDDSQIEEMLSKLAEKHRRYGFRKLFQKSRQLGHIWNHKRVYKIYCQMQLNLRRKPKKRLPAREKIVLEVPFECNISWSVNFMSDALKNGRRFRTVNVIDDFNRYGNLDLARQFIHNRL